MSIHITTARATDPDVAAMLREHLREVEDITPAGSPSIREEDLLKDSAQLWAAWRDGRVVGIVALVQLEEGHGELRSMRTMASARRQGVGAALLARLLADAESAGYRRISLETGVDERFEPARRLYTRRGFDLTGPFGTYPKNSQSVFMTLEL
nr:GNAT family N-acetyltransferase [Actinomycetales bacterium]